MILRILLFISYTVLVSSNTGFPVIPAQTYPFYQQNGYSNPSANQPNNITPYSQGMSAQISRAPSNLSTSNIRQILLNKILSSPSVQSILDSNHKGYSSNLAELSYKPIASNPAKNYFAVHENNYNYKTTDATKENKEMVSSTSEKPKKKRKSRRKDKGEQKNEHNSSKDTKRNDDLTQNVETRQTEKKTKKRHRKPSVETTPETGETSNKKHEANKTKTKRKKSKENKKVKPNPSDDESQVENPKPRRKFKKKSKSDKDNVEDSIPEHQTIPNVSLKDTTDSINLAHLSEGIIEESRIPRNLVYDDLLKSLPDNIGNNFMKGLPQFDNNFPEMSNFFANFFQTMKPSTIETNHKKAKKRRRPKRNKKQNNKRTGPKNRNSTEITVPVPTSIILAVDTKADVVTTERTIYINEKSKTNIESISKDENSQLIDEASEIEQKKMKEYGSEETTDMHSERRDFDPITKSYDPNDDNKHINNGYIDDYYPLFTDNAAYNADNKEVFVKNLGDTKYYYATDKNNRRRFEAFGFPERITKDYEINKKYDDIEKETIRNYNKNDLEDKSEEETQFRSPPRLELPDFETRRVEKTEINPEPVYYFDTNTDMNPRFVGDKSSYSEAKTPYYAGPKYNDIKTSKDKLPKDVETIFANSKVVKYGAEEDKSYVETSQQGLTDENNFKDGGTTYVLAKSIDYPESFW